MVNVVAMASQPHLYGTTFAGQWVADCGPSEVQECYRGWEPEVEDMLKVNHVSLDNVQTNKQAHSVHRTTNKVGHS